jgi:hypothetical protein
MALLLGCSTKKSAGQPGFSIAGNGVEIVPAPGMSAALLDNGTVIFGPRVDRPLPNPVNNVAVKAGKPPTKPLVARQSGVLTILSDGEEGTTSIALGRGMTSYDGVLLSAQTSTHTGPWVLIVAGKEQAWKVGERIDVSDDGAGFTTFATK